MDLTLIFTAKDGTKCTLTGGKVNIAHNTVGRLTLTGKEFKDDIPAGALPGVFSVSNDDGANITKVHFSQGNLYWDGDSFEFEDNQYGFKNSWDANHVSHFYWSKTASVAYAGSYSDSGASGDDVFFTNAAAETAKADFTVGGVTGKYRTLTTKEWQYLFNTRTMTNGRNATVIYQAVLLLKVKHTMEYSSILTIITEMLSQVL